MTTESSKTVERALEILLRLGDLAPAGLSLAALAAELGESRTAIHRAIVPMVRKGFVVPIGKRGGFRLGPAIYGMAQRRTPIFDMAQFLRPAIVEIAGRTRHATYLLARIGLDAFCIEMMIGSAPTQTLVGGVGGRVPMGIGPASVAMLATLDDATCNSIIDGNADRFPAYAGFTAAMVRQAVTAARRDGYASEIAAFHADGGAVSVALPGRSGQAGFAISVAAHSELMTPDMIRSTVAIIREMAAAIEIAD